MDNASFNRALMYNDMNPYTKNPLPAPALFFFSIFSLHVALSYVYLKDRTILPGSLKSLLQGYVDNEICER